MSSLLVIMTTNSDYEFYFENEVSCTQVHIGWFTHTIFAAESAIKYANRLFADTITVARKNEAIDLLVAVQPPVILMSFDTLVLDQNINLVKRTFYI